MTEKKSMKILVDADACPVKGIITAMAKKFGVPVTMLIDTSHTLSDDYGEIITVAKSADSVDFALMRILSRGDVVVTQDYGLAAMALGKGATVINQNGLVYTDRNIETLLFERHLAQKVRRSGGRTKGPAKRTREDDERFARAFELILSQASKTDPDHRRASAAKSL